MVPWIYLLETKILFDTVHQLPGQLTMVCSPRDVRHMYCIPAATLQPTSANHEILHHMFSLDCSYDV